MVSVRTGASAVLLAVCLAAPAGAADFAVNSTADTHDEVLADGVCADADGACTLRAALEQSNAAGSPDAVTVPAGTYTLTITARLLIDASVTLTGAGPDATVVDAGTDTGVLELSGGTSTISGVTLTGGGGPSGNGLVMTDGVVTADRIAVRDNISQTGGASGAGIYLFEGELTLTRSSVTGNTARASSASGLGGGIFVGQDANLTARRTTIADNRVESAGAGVSLFGGGLFSYGITALDHVTFAGNRAEGGEGGNLYTFSSGPTVSLRDTILAGGVATNGANCGGKAPQALGRDLDSGTTCGFGPDHRSDTDPLLGPLTGGAAIPGAGSPALDATACGEGTTDQRGQPIPVGAACDIGASELGGDLAVSFTSASASVAAGSEGTYVAKVENTGLDASSATLSFELPPGATVTALAPAAGTCEQLTCALGPLAQGGSVQVTLVLRLPTAGAAALTARVAGSLPEVSAANDAVTTTTTVTPVGGGPVVTPPDQQPVPDTTKPVLSKVNLKGRLRARKGGTLGFSLSEAAKVEVVVARLVKRKGKTKARRLGTLSKAAAAGAGTIKLPKKIGGTRLRRGKLRLTLTATDAAGNRSAAVRRQVRVKR